MVFCSTRKGLADGTEPQEPQDGGSPQAAERHLDAASQAAGQEVESRRTAVVYRHLSRVSRQLRGDARHAADDHGHLGAVYPRSCSPCDAGGWPTALLRGDARTGRLVSVRLDVAVHHDGVRQAAYPHPRHPQLDTSWPLVGTGLACRAALYHRRSGLLDPSTEAPA